VGRSVRDAGPGSSPAAVVAAAVERRRAERLAALPRFYRRTRAARGGARPALDGERILAVLRRRRGGEPPDSISTALARGALLDEPALARIAGARWPRGPRLAARLGVLDPEIASGRRGGTPWPHVPAAVEAVLTDALDRARAARAAGPGGDAATVRGFLAAERRDRRAVMDELRDAGAGAASQLERDLATSRLAAWVQGRAATRWGSASRPGHVAAVELEPIRLRGALARVTAGWSDPASRGSWGGGLMARLVVVSSADLADGFRLAGPAIHVTRPGAEAARAIRAVVAEGDGASSS